MDKEHSLYEDLLALILGSALVSLGIIFFNKVGLLTGGTAGLAIFITKVSDVSFGEIFFILNLPFYILSMMRMGWRFTLNTFIAIAIVSFAVDHLYHIIEIAYINSSYAAIMGGGMIGAGLLAIFRHKMSLGGFNILALFLQERFGIRDGKVLMALDCTILVMSLFIVDISLILLSVAGAAVINLILALNHKPGRYRP